MMLKELLSVMTDPYDRIRISWRIGDDVWAAVPSGDCSIEVDGIEKRLPDWLLTKKICGVHIDRDECDHDGQPFIVIHLS